MRATDAVHDDPAAVPDQVEGAVLMELPFRVIEYEEDIARLRALGCRCLLRCEVDGEVESARFRAVPLNDVIAATCIADCHRS